MTQQIRIAVAGANGRMGKVLVEAVQQNPRTVLTGALEHAGSDALGLDAGYAIGLKTGVPISADMDAVLANCDVVIDFTRPDASLPLIAKCAEKTSKWSSAQPVMTIMAKRPSPQRRKKTRLCSPPITAWA